MSIDNISFTSTNTNMTMSISNGFQDQESNCDDSELGTEFRNESNLNNEHKLSEKSKEDDNIIPWRAQLRKTNSRLSLIG